MKRLTSEILKEEAKKYFPEIKAQFDCGVDDPHFMDTTVRVLPEYPEWIKNRKGKIPSYQGSKSTGWAMQDYIFNVLGLAHHLIKNNYPQEAVFAMLPRDFSLRITKRLNE